MKKKKIFYWAPCLDSVGTVVSSMNSALAMAKYKKDKYEITIINVFGEWDKYREKLEAGDVNVLNLTFSYEKFLPKKGFIRSRFSYWVIFLISFFPLVFLLKKKQPNFLIIHLITSLPLFLLNIFYFNTNFILRISGFPKLNIFRKKLWEKTSKKLFKITCPTNELLEEINKDKIFETKKLGYLSDAIINLKNFKLNNKFTFPQIKKKQNIILAAGRLTKQKNFKYLINEFDKFIKLHENYELIILGDGEQKNYLEDLIINKNIQNKVHLAGNVNNVYEYMRKSDVFVLSSLWEEMGFVIVEAAFNNLFIISSDCKNGPKEFLNYGNNGILFTKNKENELFESFKKFHYEDKTNIYKKKILAKKKSKNFTKFKHHLLLENILLNENSF